MIEGKRTKMITLEKNTNMWTINFLFEDNNEKKKT